MITPPIGSSQKESAFRRGNAMSAAPIISGITKFPRPAKTGTTTVKIISAACSETRTLKVCGLKYWSPGWASSARKSIAMNPPMTKNVIVVTRYWTPITLWSVFGPEVVLPAAGAVPRVVLGPGRPAGEVVGPVVEGADPDQEADRERHGRDRDERDAVPDRIPVGRPADQAGEADPGEADERRRPQRPPPAGRREAVDARRPRRRRVMAVGRCASRRVRRRRCLSSGLPSLPGHFVFARDVRDQRVDLGRRHRGAEASAA